MRDRSKAEGLMTHAQALKNRARVLEDVGESALAPRAQRHLRCIRAEIDALEALASKLL